MLFSVQAQLGGDGLGQAIACVDANSFLDLVAFSPDVACNLHVHQDKEQETKLNLARKGERTGRDGLRVDKTC